MARRSETDEWQFSLDAFSGAPEQVAEAPAGLPLEQFDMPSLRPEARRIPAAPTVPHAYLDLRNLYPDAPVPVGPDAPVIHRASLASIEGIGQVMDWAAEGHITLLDVAPLFGRHDDFRTALDHISIFVEEDLGGRMVQLTDTRVLVLPPGIAGVRGVEDAAETVRPEGDGRRW
ncbi:MAG TPA: hypothetical protein HA276_01080 [Candidatus Poseidoniaceae archaeon]|nr:MAG: hypothetical protein CBD01_003445 [Euryarchaeota archaeon TMED141]DAC08317.1 MAG TPA: hypothetical protein D7I09_08040 [Candidatus Poseidoniales archaeon]DAC18855.1 MAG TPA: hypothetical protein D7I01_01055 [Candidatus Poseidoniales archaeon]HII19259.1 hypothetical protein [Candidatus Poseidoniaceae archaeon]HII96259.1 hypothetical protein [Candidatus Poseidoniaceae archaeon]